MTALNTALPQTDDPLGLWEPVEDVPSAPASSAGGMVSFSVSDAPAVPAVQPVRLPANAEAASAQLAAMRSTMRRGQVQLTQAERKISNLRSGFRPAKARGVSFSTPAGDEPEVKTPEVSLYSALDTIELTPPEALTQVRQTEDGELKQWQKFVAQVQYKVANPVQVKTQVGDWLVGYTSMDWSGDFTTVWPPNVSSAEMQLHSQTVELVLLKIIARLRLVTVVSTEASKLAVKMAGPPGTQLLAIPAVWRFVREVLETLHTQPEFQN